MPPAARGGLLTRAVLLGPAPIRLAAARAAGPQQAWMLRQPRAVRVSYAREVLGTEHPEDVAREIWMLRQPPQVRESYIREVLGPL